MSHAILGYFAIWDLLVISLFFVLIIGISVYYSRQTHNVSDFFLSGRKLPWYIAGTAMVATTFAADTPLAVTELIAMNGIAGNWLWWNMAIGGLLTVFFFAKLWRRADILTDLEFIELRYEGNPAAFLRGFRAIYLGILMNAIILAWVHKAMEKIIMVVMPGISPLLLVVCLALFVASYAALSGLAGTSRTDSIQFIVALAGCIIFAVFVIQIPEIGSLQNLKAQLPTNTLSFLPSISTKPAEFALHGALSLPIGALIAYVGIQWWASWYPGADPGGGGYIAQRMMSAKDERHSLLATLWFNIAHYTLRPWPWIVVALAALVILPRANDVNELQAENPALYQEVVALYEANPTVLTNPERYDPEFVTLYETYQNTVDPGVMYPKLMVKFLPAGILGLLVAVFLAAYMSTIASQLNWGTSYVIHDFYKRFIARHQSEKHYVLVSRLGILLLVILSLLISHYLLTTVKGAWEFIINASAGLGGVLLLRWYWWRINAWSEITAMIAPIPIYLLARYLGIESPYTLYPTVLGTTLIWLIATLLTKPVSKNKLEAFYKKTYPGGIGWKKFHSCTDNKPAPRHFRNNLINWLLSLLAVYTALFGTGQLLFEGALRGLPWLGGSTLCFLVVYWNLSDKKKANSESTYCSEDQNS